MSSDYDKDDLYDKLFIEISRNQKSLYVNSAFINKIKNEVVTYSAVKTKLEYDGNKYIGQGIAYIDKEIMICNNERSQKISSLNNNEIVIDEGTLNLITNNNYFEAYESNKNKYDNKEEILIKYLKDNSIIGKIVKINIYKHRVL